MRQHASDYVRKVRALLTDLVKLNGEISESVKTCTDLKELADYAHAMHEAAQMLEGMEKKARQQRALAEQLACVIWVTQCPDGEPHNIKTEYVTATPRVTMIASVPKRSTQPEEFAKLMDYMGIPRHLWEGEGDAEVVRCHWPGLVTWLSRLAEEGKPLPEGIDISKTYPQYALTLRRRKSADE